MKKKYLHLANRESEFLRNVKRCGQISKLSRPVDNQTQHSLKRLCLCYSGNQIEPALITFMFLAGVFNCDPIVLFVLNTVLYEKLS